MELLKNKELMHHSNEVPKKYLAFTNYQLYTTIVGQRIHYLAPLSEDNA